MNRAKYTAAYIDQLHGAYFELCIKTPEEHQWRISGVIILKGELHSNYIFLYFLLIGLEWDAINLFTKMNIFFFQNSHFSTIYTRHIYDLLFTNMNIF